MCVVCVALSGAARALAVQHGQPAGQQQGGDLLRYSAEYHNMPTVYPTASRCGCLSGAVSPVGLGRGRTGPLLCCAGHLLDVIFTWTRILR